MISLPYTGSWFTKRTCRRASGKQHMCGAVWDVENFNRLCFCMSHENFKDQKSEANKQGFEIKLNLTSHIQPTPKTTRILNKVFCAPGPNLVILAWTVNDSLRGQYNKCCKFYLGSLFWPWSSRSITSKTNRNLNQGLLHIWSKFCNPSFNEWWVIAGTSSWLPPTDRRGQRQHPKAKTGL